MLPVPKSGDLSDTGNYREISLTSVVAKLVNKIILIRIQSKTDKFIRPNQNGFRWPGRTTINKINKSKRFDQDFKSLWYIKWSCDCLVIWLWWLLHTDAENGNKMYLGQVTWQMRFSTEIFQNYLLLAGHIMRHKTEVSNKHLLWQPDGRRKRGRRITSSIFLKILVWQISTNWKIDERQR